MNPPDLHLLTADGVCPTTLKTARYRPQGGEVETVQIVTTDLLPAVSGGQGWLGQMRIVLIRRPPTDGGRQRRTVWVAARLLNRE